jgi:hypothetical protein
MVKVAATVGSGGIGGVLTSSGADLANGNTSGAALTLFTGGVGGVAKASAEAGNAESLVAEYGDNAIKATDVVGTVKEAAESTELVPLTELTPDQLDAVYAHVDELTSTTFAQRVVGGYDKALTGMAPPDREEFKEHLKKYIESRRAEEAKLAAYGAAILHRENVKTANEAEVGSCMQEAATPIPR